MGRARVLEDIRIMRFEEVLDRHERGYLTQAEAGEMLGMSERTLRRWQVRYREEGEAGLRDRRVGQPSPRRADPGEIARATALYAEMYDGFTARHFHEKLVERHGYRLGYTVTRLALQAAGLVRRAPRRGAHRRRRPRRPLPGMLLHQDAARHAWLAGRPPLDLVVTLDDATSEVCSAILVEEEGTASSFRALCEVIADRGLFCALYTDRGSHYFHTPVAGGGVDREQPTQVGRALGQLGIEHIAAYSPQARGRSERAFRTLEDRLPKELALAGITEIEAANAWLRTRYLPAHNARFAVLAEQPGSAFVPVAPEQWRDVLCLQETRQVGNDNCVRWKGRRLQIPKSPLRPHFTRATVRLHEYPDGAIALFWGPHRIADFPPPPAEPNDLAA
jgi:transposase